MTFDEFFRKKKINLTLLQGAQPALYAEFENHYAQMGEKSFDHTKKFWFNKLRRLYPLPPEPKVEKVRIENPIAEQAVTETIAQEASPVTRPGFTPRFKAPAKPATPLTEKQPGDPEPVPEHKIIKQKTDTPPSAAEEPKPAYKPRFKAPPKPAAPAESPSAPALSENTAQEQPKAEETHQEDAPLPIAPKPAFKPRFKPGLTKPVDTPATESKPDVPAQELPAPAETTAAAPAPAESELLADTPPTAEDAPKPAYKPRFNPKMAKPKPPEE